jgi:CxxC motif-containing protein (DUF1111 family)
MFASGKTSAVVLSTLVFAVADFAAGADPATKAGDAVAGRTLFERNWTPSQGLGPLFNERSCVACHSLGGVGGAGPNSKNIELLSVEIPALVQTAFERDRKNAVPPTIAESGAALRDLSERAMRLHTGLKNGSMMLHLHGDDPGYPAFREKLLGLSPTPTPTAPPPPSASDSPNESPKPAGVEPRRLESPEPIQRIAHGNVLLSLTARNSTALFGAGLIDGITEFEIKSAAAVQQQRHPQVAGRFHGRFGWRGQTSTLAEFVAGACKLELGLETPSLPFPTPSIPISPIAANHPPAAPDGAAGQVTINRKRPAPEISAAEFRDLLSFIALLPAPVRRPTTDDVEAAGVEKGEGYFSAIGCDVCHRPSLGKVSGIYSDLLLHDLGSGLADSQPAPAPIVSREERFLLRGGSYYSPPTRKFEPTLEREQLSQWRTPPLWGLADSAPYLHDGRAPTIEAAILAHGGQAAPSVTEFAKLNADGRRDLLAFLRSLVAPNISEHMKTLAPPTSAARPPRGIESSRANK